MNRWGRTTTKHANLTTPELLRFVDRSNPETAELAYRLEDALDDLQEIINIVETFPGVSAAADARLTELVEITEEYRNMFTHDALKAPTTEINHDADKGLGN